MQITFANVFIFSDITYLEITLLEKTSYFSQYNPKPKNKTTLLSPTLKVAEKKVPLIFLNEQSTAV